MLPTPLGVQPTGLKERSYAGRATDGFSIALGLSAFHHLNKTHASAARNFPLWGQVLLNPVRGHRDFVYTQPIGLVDCPQLSTS